MWYNPWVNADYGRFTSIQQLGEIIMQAIRRNAEILWEEFAGSIPLHWTLDGIDETCCEVEIELINIGIDVEPGDMIHDN